MLYAQFQLRIGQQEGRMVTNDLESLDFGP